MQVEVQDLHDQLLVLRVQATDLLREAEACETDVRALIARL